MTFIRKRNNAVEPDVIEFNPVKFSSQYAYGTLLTQKS